MNYPTPPPRWITFIILIFTLPLFLFPWLLHNLPPEAGTAKTLVQIYPFYMALSSWLAWKAYPQRHYVTWLLLAVMLLSTIAIILLSRS